MRIGLLHNSVLPPANYGGIERIVVGLAYEYRKLGHEVVIISRKGSNMQDFEMHELPEDYKSRHPSSWLPSKIDILHAHEPLSEKPTVPFLVSIHGNGRADETYWPNTNFLSRSHCQNHNGKYYVYNGVDAHRFPYVAEKEDYVVFLARASWRVKNLKTCLAYAKDLGVRLEVIGGSGRDTKYVKYHGMIGEAEGKLEILSKARALIYPTNWHEPCAVAPLESLACGTPVIGSSNGCMPELVRDGRTGVICSNYPDLLASREKIQSIKPSDCRDSVETFFSLERMGMEYINLMSLILDKGELDQQPRHNFQPGSINYLYKPTLLNRFRLWLTGKV